MPGFRAMGCLVPFLALEPLFRHCGSDWDDAVTGVTGLAYGYDGRGMLNCLSTISRTFVPSRSKMLI